MSAHPDREELMAWRDDEVATARAAEIATHVAGCTDCRDFVDALGSLSAAVQSWTVAPAPASSPRVPAAPVAAISRRAVMWAAAAVLLIGVLATVRVECAPAPTCDPNSLHLSFLPSRSRDAAAEQVKPGTPLAQTQAFERDWLSRRRLPVKPAPGAKVTVVIFLDWQCPACRMAETAYNPVFAEFEQKMPGAVVVQVKDYPLNMKCNPNVPVEMHPAACEAAVAVRLAHEHGTAPALISYLFANQESLTPDMVRKAAITIGKINDFSARSAAVLKDVARDVAEGHALEVGGTPTCFINGILARGDEGKSLFSPEEIRLAINTELKRVK